MYFIVGLWYNKSTIKLFFEGIVMAAEKKKNTYTAAEVAELQTTIQQQQAEIDELKKK